MDESGGSDTEFEYEFQDYYAFEMSKEFPWT